MNLRHTSKMHSFSSRGNIRRSWISDSQIRTMNSPPVSTYCPALPHFRRSVNFLGTMKDHLANFYIGPLLRECENSQSQKFEGGCEAAVSISLRVLISTRDSAIVPTGSILEDRDRPRRGAANDRYPIWIYDRLEESSERIGKR